MTAEYSLLPGLDRRAHRSARPARGKQRGRTVEIQRLIGRALRAVADFEALGERTLWLDCDVLQADGGTRCAAISGAYVAAARALDRFGLSQALPDSVAAVSVGIVDGEPLLDLDYSEDSSAEVDLNVVMTGDGRLVEVQATAEREPFDRDELDELLDLARGGHRARSREAQEAALDAARLSIPTLDLGGGAAARSPSRLRSAARSGSSASCASARPGFRTHLLVSVGSALFTLVSAYGFREFLVGGDASSAPTRRGSRRRS